jgi:hypothetical protein
MKKLANLSFYTVLLVFVVALSLFSTAAQAYVYDDFTNIGINPNLWVDLGPNTGLFSQPGDGYLYFNDSIGGQEDLLRSYNPVSGAYFVSMQFSNFQATNTQPTGQGLGSGIAFILGYWDETTATTAYLTLVKSANFQGFQAAYYHDGARTFLKYIPLNVNSGWLGIRYNGILGAGGKVDFLYDSGAGWKLLDSYAPNFPQTPWFSIQGFDNYGQSLSFRVNQVQIFRPSPAPNMLLLEPTH